MEILPPFNEKKAKWEILIKIVQKETKNDEKEYNFEFSETHFLIF
ncbi:hypothetical protein CCAN11_2310012 [Capnocytophaga canimorsus]|uniref:Uncharacterized protein n=1 Tax=Capnocytophaga canimorsus TaxID=28188 RepID=A0A0B7IN76_9FLAO|nr:hypothetical protein CCAN11_2310012 [Capnocytophaga canimorsus]